MQLHNLVIDTKKTLDNLNYKSITVVNVTESKFNDVLNYKLNCIVDYINKENELDTTDLDIKVVDYNGSKKDLLKLVRNKKIDFNSTKLVLVPYVNNGRANISVKVEKFEDVKLLA